MIRLHKSTSLPAVGLTGFETPMTEEERAIQAAVHRFAREVMRPIGRQLDRVVPGRPARGVHPRPHLG